MSIRKKGILVVVAAAVIAVAVAVPVFAATGDTDATAPGEGYCGQGYGPMRADGLRGIDAAAEALGMDVDELAAERRDGKSLAEIAEEQGISTDELIEALLSAREAALDEAVADGRITQERADEMLEHMSEHIADHIDDAELGPHGEGRGPGGRGMNAAGQGVCVNR